MKLNELLTESQHAELTMLKEGPIGAIGRGIAKGIGGLAKGAGMIAGIGKGLKTAYQKGKATSAAHIGGDVPARTDPAAQATYDKEYARLTTPQAQPAAAAAAPAQTAAPAAPAQTAAPAAGATPDAATQARIAAAPQGYDTETGKPNPAPSAKPAAAPAAQPAAAEQPAAAPAADITKIQQTISKLPPEQKKEIVDILQADPAIKKAAPAPAAEKPAAPAQPAAAPAAGGEQKPGFLKTATDKIQDKAKAQAGTKPSQAEIDADRARIMGPTSDSIVRKQPAIVEGFSLYRKK